MAPMILRDFETGSRDFNFAENSTDFFIKMIRKLNRKKNLASLILKICTVKKKGGIVGILILRLII